MGHILRIILISIMLLGCRSKIFKSDQIPKKLVLLGFEGVCDRSFYDFSFREADEREVYSFSSDSDEFLEWLFSLEIFLKIEDLNNGVRLDVHKEEFRETINDDRMGRVVLIAGCYFDQVRSRDLYIEMISTKVSEGVVSVQIYIYK